MLSLPFLIRIEQYVPHSAENIFKCISLNENHCIFHFISMKFVPKGLVDNN